MSYQIFLSPLVKRCALITYKQHGICDLFHELPNDLKKLGNIKKLPKLHRNDRPAPIPPPLPAKSKAPLILEENS